MLIECAQLPNNREEIPTPNAARHQPHLKDIADKIPPLDESAEILILLGRDIPRVHKVQDQTSGPSDAPYAQKLELGWVLIGEVCLDRVRKPYKVNTCKTDLMEDRGKLFGKSCSCHYQIRPKPNTSLQIICGSEEDICYKSLSPNFGSSIFHTTCNDNKIAPSIEDKEFIKIMDKEFVKGDSNSWTAPFRSPRVVLPNNSAQAKSRFDSLKRTLGNKPIMREHFVAFMKKILDNNHAEPAPPLKTGEECWYLPSFGVYHPRKPDQIRVVFDSSAQFKGVSLNNVLTGPNLTNSIIGVLVRFRKERVAFMADVQQMFHCFLIREDHRNYLRFLWHRNNDLDEDVIEYRMRVHVFGNSPSPAVATYGLRRTAKEGEAEFGHDVRQFIERDFYVDDCLKSLSTPKEAINLLKRTQHLLSSANLRLHKIVSNNSELMKAFDPKDHASDLKDLDLTKDLLPTQRSLGLHWDVNQDTFTFQVSTEERPFTRRGVLSTVNSLYDPLGFVAPITVQGKLILRQLTEDRVDWNVTLPADLQPKWEKWKLSLKVLKQLQIPRNYLSCSLSLTKEREIHIFCDASNEAVAAVVYLKASDSSGQPRVHVFGNSPSPAVATYGLRRTAKEGEAEFGHDVRQFIERDFYVDDCLKSLSTPKEAINLLKRTQHFYLVPT
ncbi:hypothetical protein XENTR_v10011388 [Xenopus tropicalis]|nr:hypothetical protein XENTR_v10011388 [Xenopus tropicalis]